MLRPPCCEEAQAAMLRLQEEKKKKTHGSHPALKVNKGEPAQPTPRSCSGHLAEAPNILEQRRATCCTLSEFLTHACMLSHFSHV